MNTDDIEVIEYVEDMEAIGSLKMLKSYIEDVADKYSVEDIMKGI